MSRKASVDNEAAKVAFEKSLAKGSPLTPVQLAAKFNLSPSTIYRASWFKNRAAAQPQTGEK